MDFEPIQSTVNVLGNSNYRHRSGQTSSHQSLNLSIPFERRGSIMLKNNSSDGLLITNTEEKRKKFKRGSSDVNHIFQSEKRRRTGLNQGLLFPNEFDEDEINIDELDIELPSSPMRMDLMADDEMNINS